MVRVALLASCLLLSACESTGLLEEILANSSGGDSSLSSQTVADGLREALTVVEGEGMAERFLDDLSRPARGPRDGCP